MWFFWTVITIILGATWVYMPRMTAGILLCIFSGHYNIGIALAVVGAIVDIISLIDPE